MKLNVKLIALLIAMCPFYAYGKCDALSGNTSIVSPIANDENKTNNENETKYRKVISEYNEKHKNNYRPEVFFTQFKQFFTQFKQRLKGTDITIKLF